jgi:hypothetical protein
MNMHIDRTYQFQYNNKIVYNRYINTGKIMETPKFRWIPEQSIHMNTPKLAEAHRGPMNICTYIYTYEYVYM